MLPQILFGYILVVLTSPAQLQTVRNVRVVDHIDYVIEVIQDVVSQVEQMEWCNLKLPDIVTNVNETVIDKHYEGTVTYSNGFVVSIQGVDIPQSTVQQVWTWNRAESKGDVTLRGTLRMRDLDVGYDVVADMGDGYRWYTAVYRHPLVNFAFTIIYDPHTEGITVKVDGTVPKSTLLPTLLPQDNDSSVFTILFDPTLTAPGITAWGPGVFQPISEGVVARVEFPRICFDCPP